MPSPLWLSEVVCGGAFVLLTYAHTDWLKAKRIPPPFLYFTIGAVTTAAIAISVLDSDTPLSAATIARQEQAPLPERQRLISSTELLISDMTKWADARTIGDPLEGNGSYDKESLQQFSRIFRQRLYQARDWFRMYGIGDLQFDKLIEDGRFGDPTFARLEVTTLGTFNEQLHRQVSGAKGDTSEGH